MLPLHRISAGLLALGLGYCFLAGCSDGDSAANPDAATEAATTLASTEAETDATQPATTTALAAETTTTQSTAESTTEAATEAATTAATTTATTEAPTQASTTPAPESQSLISYVAPDYGCQIQIPKGWVPTQGAADGVIQSETSIFQPEAPNGDSISLAIAAADSAAEFAGLTEEQLTAVYAQSFATISDLTLTPCTIGDSPAYSVKVTGDISEGVPMTMAQLLVNCEGGHFYSLTFASISGNDTAYLDTIASCFQLT